MNKPRKPIQNEEEADSIPEWMVTYSDLVTLLLTFFILLFSMASIDKARFQQIATSLNSTFGSSGGEMLFTSSGKNVFSLIHMHNSLNNPKTIDSVTQQSPHKRAAQLTDFLNAVKQIIHAEQLDKYIKIIESTETIVLRVNSVILFNSGSAEIKPTGVNTLKKLGPFLNNLNREIFVQGHTDNQPINTTLFPTNWELSTKRATNIVIFLINNCGLNPAQLTPTGNSEFKAVTRNETEAQRSQNRRIDILILK
jgi:chemotaxis protein MotB